MKVSIVDLRKLVKAAVAEQQHALSSLEPHKGNPSVAPSYYHHEGALEALQAVDQAMAGNLVNIRLLAE